MSGAVERTVSVSTERMRHAVPAGSGVGGIHGIADYWARLTLRASHPSPSLTADRITLDVLGLGIEQAMRHLARERPDFAAFEAWVLATAGAPDADAIARFNAWATGRPVPAAAAAALAAIDAMSPVLDASDLDHWDRHGYVVVREAITGVEAAAAADLLWRLVEADPTDAATWYGRRTAGIMVQHFQDPALSAARRSPRIHKAFAQLYGTGDLWCSTDRMSFNPPVTASHPFPGPDLHWDISLAAPIPLTTGGILYLTDTSEDQGALRVVPGMHRRLASWLAEIGEADPRGFDLSDQAVVIPGRAGDLIIWRHELLHGASPNTAGRPRMAQYVNRYPPREDPDRPWR